MWQPEGRRSSIQIIADILRLLRLGEAGKTEIMYTVKMSYYQTQKYLNMLLKLDLLDAVMKENRLVSYRVTEKGLKLLIQIENMQEMLHWEEALDVLRAPNLTKIVAQSNPNVESSEVKEV